MAVTLNELVYKPAMPNNCKIRKIMIIGAGEIIHDGHLPAYKIAGFEVHGIYNRTVEKAEKLAKQFNIPNVYGNLDEFIEEAIRINAVFDIALPASYICSTLERLPDNSGVLIQKPMGESIEEATNIIEICTRKNLTAGVNFQLRQAPYMIQLKNIIDSGLLGEIYDASWKLTIDHPWHLWSFLNDVERCEINYHSIHYIDALRYLFGDPQSVYCKTLMSPKAPNMKQSRSNIILDYGEYLGVNISTNHGHNYSEKYQESYLKVEGTKGAAKLTLGLVLNYPEGRPDKLEVITLEKGVWEELPIVGSWFPEAFIGTMGGLLKKIEDPEYNYVNSVSDAYKTMLVTEACYKSSASGGTKIIYNV